MGKYLLLLFGTVAWNFLLSLSVVRLEIGRKVCGIGGDTHGLSIWNLELLEVWASLWISLTYLPCFCVAVARNWSNFREFYNILPLWKYSLHPAASLPLSLTWGKNRNLLESWSSSGNLLNQLTFNHQAITPPLPAIHRRFRKSTTFQLFQTSFLVINNQRTIMTKK